MDLLLATFNHMRETADMLWVKYGITVALHYINMLCEKMQSEVFSSLAQSYKTMLCESV